MIGATITALVLVLATHFRLQAGFRRHYGATPRKSRFFGFSIGVAAMLAFFATLLTAGIGLVDSRFPPLGLVCRPENPPVGGGSESAGRIPVVPGGSPAWRSAATC